MLDLSTQAQQKKQEQPKQMHHGIKQVHSCKGPGMLQRLWTRQHRRGPELRVEENDVESRGSNFAIISIVVWTQAN